MAAGGAGDIEAVVVPNQPVHAALTATGAAVLGRDQLVPVVVRGGLGTAVASLVHWGLLRGAVVLTILYHMGNSFARAFGQTDVKISLQF